VIAELAAMPGPAATQLARVRLAHAACLPSQVTRSPEPPGPPSPQMSLTAAVVPHPAGRRALLIAETSASLSTPAGGGDQVDLVLAAVLGQGLHLLASADETAPRSPGWLVTLPSPAGTMISDPAGAVFYAGTLPQPLPWRRLMARHGAAELLTGPVGLLAGGGAELTARLAEAARRGELAGGTIAVRRQRRGRAGR
jgi:hypothetical protein